MHYQWQTPVLALLLASCASYKGLQELDVVATGEAAGNYRDVASCVIETLRIDHSGYHYIEGHQPKEKTARISAGHTTLVGTPSVGFAWQISLAQTGAETITAEVRSLKSIWGKPVAPDDLLGIVKDCE